MQNLNSTISAERVHIGFFGCRNAGKSSIVNAITGQNLAVVSDTAGTTTDPVYKAMELLPLGPVMIIDTPGIDDQGELGELRVKKTHEILRKTDIAVLVIDGIAGETTFDRELMDIFKNTNTPYIVCINKSENLNFPMDTHGNNVYVSAKTGYGIEKLKNAIAALKPKTEERPIVGDLISRGDTVLLVIPIDSAAPKGRIILPQQLVLREVLDVGAVAICCRPEELPGTLSNLKTPPALVITDSQAFGTVKDMVAEDINLTSFSILMARHKGTLSAAIKAAKTLETLQNGDRILIAEGCTHHRQCEDIGTVKIPKWLKSYTGKDLQLDFTSGREFPKDLSPYKMVIHCGGCTLNEKEMQYRAATARQQEIPFCNYGIFIATVNGIIERSIRFLPK